MIINHSVMQDTSRGQRLFLLVWHLLMNVKHNFPEAFHTNFNLPVQNAIRSTDFKETWSFLPINC